MSIPACGTTWQWSKWCVCVLGLGPGLAQCAVSPGSSRQRDDPAPAPEGAGILSAATLRALALPAPAFRGSKRPRIFYFAVRPPIWTVSLDGRRLSRMPGTPVRLKIGPGRHVLQFRHSAVRPLRVVIGAKEPGRTLRYRLRWRPGILLVDTGRRPPNATFRFKAPPALARSRPRPVGLPITIPFPQSAPLDATIQVYAVGYRHALREVQLVPGQRTHVRVKLRRLRRRQSWNAAFVLRSLRRRPHRARAVPPSEPR